MHPFPKLALLLFALHSFAFSQSWNSEIVYRNASGQMTYVSDSLGNHVPNWSNAGYHNGDLALPFLPNVDTISPVTGDNRAHIQAAIDALSSIPPDANGHRGALLLTAGTYSFEGTINLNLNGVVLRGVGDGADPNSNTILLSTDTNQIDILIAGNGASWDRWRDSVSGTTRDVVSEVLPMGTHWIALSDASGFFVGAPIVLHHPADSAWLATVNFGDTGNDPPWTGPYMELLYRRKVVAIAGNFVQLDAPLPHPLRRELSQTIAYIHDSTQVKREIGIESLRVDCNYAGPEDEAHAENSICLYEAENSWVRNVTVAHFVRGGIVCATANNITVQDCRAIDPISLITGSRRYNFDAEGGCNNLLFERCYATEGRHAYVSNGPATSNGIVFTGCTSVGDHTSCEGHRQWAHALLFDSLTFLQPNTTSSNPIFDRVLGLYNRGDYGTAHGWSSAHSVVWNCTAEDAYFVVEQPPSAQNYAFACRLTNGSVLGSGPFGHSAGWIEGEGQTPEIGSLYRAQVEHKQQFGRPPDPAARLEILDTTFGMWLQWLDNDQTESGYYVERSPDGQNYTRIATLPANSTSYADSLFSSGTFYYRVQTFNSTTIAPYSNWVRDTFTYVLKIPTHFDLQPKLFPNPTPGPVHLAVPAALLGPETRLRLFDTSGRLVTVLPHLQSEMQFQMDNLRPGIYFFLLEGEGFMHALKFHVLR